MPKHMPIFDEYGRIFGTIVFRMEKGRKRMFLKCKDGLILDLSDVTRFTEQLRKMDIPDEEIDKAMKFFNEKMLGFVLGAD